jgi:uncharacterized protein YodC (DUF2158 family)
MAEFKPGGVVQLKSGGPPMTVMMNPDGSHLVCGWFDDGQQLQRASFPPDCVRPFGPGLEVADLSAMVRRGDTAATKAAGHADDEPVGWAGRRIEVGQVVGTDENGLLTPFVQGRQPGGGKAASPDNPQRTANPKVT